MPEIRVLMITVEWPDKNRPTAVPFLVRQVDILRRKGIYIEVFHFRGARNPINYIRAAFAIRKKMRLAHFDIIHAQWGQSGLPALFSSKPLITTFRGSDLFGITNARGGYTLSGRILIIASKLVALCSKIIILVSARMSTRVPFRRNHFIIPSGVNIGLFKPGPKESARRKLNISHHGKIVLFGGDPQRSDKRLYLAEEAINLLKNDAIHLLFARNVNHSDMPVYYQAADVLLLTSMHEGSPNVVKEALACNTQVVSVDVGDVRERIQNIPGCFVCKNDDPVTIADCVRQSLLFSGVRDYGSYILDLDENVLADRQIDIYKNLVESL